MTMIDDYGLTAESTETRAATEPAHADYPHEPGTLYDCPACESRCFCGDIRRAPWCIYCTGGDAEETGANGERLCGCGLHHDQHTD